MIDKATRYLKLFANILQIKFPHANIYSVSIKSPFSRRAFHLRDKIVHKIRNDKINFNGIQLALPREVILLARSTGFSGIHF